MHSRLKRFAAVILMALFSAVAGGADATSAPKPLKIGISQMSLASGMEANRDRIIAGIAEAAARGVRVAVFPEGALRGQGNDRPELVAASVAAIRKAAQTNSLYVLFGGATYSAKSKRDSYWLQVIGPDGRELLRYDKLYDKHDAEMPGVFLIDGVPCTAMLCADRWLRGVEEIPIQQGAQVSFELSCNYACEWVEPYDWYWYVPRALRNNVWVIFANMGNKVTGQEDAPGGLRHGHSAVIAPDGHLFASTRSDAETFIVAELDPAQATRSEALTRAANPVLRPFWEAGLQLQRGHKMTPVPVAPLKFKETDVTIAVSQITGDLAAMESSIREARAKNADLIAFPEQAMNDAPGLARLQNAARENHITVAFGMIHRIDGNLRNSAYVIGPDGAILTRYDQISATAPCTPGTNTAAMWFSVKGVPAVVTLGRDGLWTELSELAAVAGARIHVHLQNDPTSAGSAELRRLQIWANLASYLTFTATVNVTGSAIWDDLRGMDESRAQVKDLPKPDSGPTEVYSEFSANLITHAPADSPRLIVATRHIQGVNPHHPRRTSAMNPQMDAWYGIGAKVIHPQ